MTDIARPKSIVDAVIHAVEGDTKRADEATHAILSALNLTSEAATALMDGTAAVVPVEADEDSAEEAAFWTAYGEYKQMVVDGVFPRPTLFHHMRDTLIAASPYRSNSDAGV